MALFPTAEEEAGLPWPFRTPTFAVLVSLFIGVAQIGLWRTVSPSQFDTGEAQFFGFVSQASVEVSILVMTLMPAMAALLLTVTTRVERGLAFLSSVPSYHRGVWRLFSPVLPAAATLLLVLLFVPIQADAGNAGVSAFLGTLLSGSIFLQVCLVIGSTTAIRTQIAEEGKDTAAELVRLEREGKGRIVMSGAGDPPGG